jgi:uncharacterized protein with PQ loop repeat
MPLISRADLMMVRAEARRAQTGTTMHELALAAGTAAAAIFMISQLPMLIKARRTKDLASYSIANIGLANVGNVLYAVYVVQVPVGPAWAIHGFNLTTAGLMLFWYLRYGWRHAGEPREIQLGQDLLDMSTGAKSSGSFREHRSTDQARSGAGPARSPECV